MICVFLSLDFSMYVLGSLLIQSLISIPPSAIRRLEYIPTEKVGGSHTGIDVATRTVVPNGFNRGAIREGDAIEIASIEGQEHEGGLLRPAGGVRHVGGEEGRASGGYSIDIIVRPFSPSSHERSSRMKSIKISLATNDSFFVFFFSATQHRPPPIRPPGVRHHHRSRWIPAEAPRRTSGASWVEEDHIRRPLPPARVLPLHPHGTVTSLSYLVREALRRNTRYRRQGNEHGG
jgi:hypothetical protein